MRRLVTPLLLLLVCLALPATVHAQTLFFDYLGFDYEYPNPNPSQFGEAGSVYNGVGYVPSLFAPLVADTANYEYTYVMTGLSPVGTTVSGSYLIINYSPGTLVVYEDPKVGGTHADFGINPPNAISPSTFSDGTSFVEGTLTNFQLVINTSDGSGSFEAQYDVTGGSQLTNIPVDQRQGWTFAGITDNALNIPTGYEHQVDGQTFLNEPTPATKASWGQLKARYR